MSTGLAERAGVEKGDRVVRVNYEPITTREQLAFRCSPDCGVMPGATVLLSLQRCKVDGADGAIIEHNEFEVEVRMGKAEGDWKSWVRDTGTPPAEEEDAAPRDVTGLRRNITHLRRKLLRMEERLNKEEAGT